MESAEERRQAKVTDDGRCDLCQKLIVIEEDLSKTKCSLCGSCIVGPLGEVLAGPDFEGPTILRADLDLNKIPEGKYDLDTPGHYARPDIFQLQVNVRKQDIVTTHKVEKHFPES